MKITTKTTTETKIDNVKIIKSVSEITKDCRLFYSLGSYQYVKKFKNGMLVTEKNFIHSGIYKEIYNVEALVKSYKHFIEKELNHHKFVIYDNQ